MDHKGSGIRLRVLAGIFLAVMAVFLGVLYDTQVNDYEYYYASSIRTIARPEAVEAARGNLTDRDGKVLASSRPSYNLTFDASLLDGGQDESQALLRLLELCRDRGLTWEDGLPISLEAPFAYRLDTLGSSARGRFLTYLREDLEDAAEALGDYLLRHPDLLETVDEDGERKNPADRILASDRLDTDRKKADALLEELTADQLSAALLSGAGLSADRLISLMREDLDVPAAFSDGEARLVLGVQYEIRSRDLSREDPYVLAEDIDRETISLLNDGAYAGAKVSLSSVREYETAYAAHILGYLGSIESQEEKDALGEGYAWNDSVGKTGAEAAFEKYLKGDDGTRVVSMNEDGKVTGEYYSTEPVPGATVELTVDLDLQQAVEDALAATIQEMDRTDPNDRRGGAAVVLDIDTREVLAMASYPTYDLSHLPPAGDLRGPEHRHPPALQQPGHPGPLRPRLHPQAPHRRGGAGGGGHPLHHGAAPLPLQMVLPQRPHPQPHQLRRRGPRPPERDGGHHEVLQLLLRGDGLPPGDGHLPGLPGRLRPGEVHRHRDRRLRRHPAGEPGGPGPGPLGGLRPGQPGLLPPADRQLHRHPGLRREAAAAPPAQGRQVL